MFNLFSGIRDTWRRLRTFAFASSDQMAFLRKIRQHQEQFMSTFQQLNDDVTTFVATANNQINTLKQQVVDLQSQNTGLQAALDAANATIAANQASLDQADAAIQAGTAQLGT